MAVGRPRQAPVAWQKDAWIERYPELADRFGALPPRLDRAAFRRLVFGYPHDAEGAFSGAYRRVRSGMVTNPVAADHREVCPRRGA